MGWTGAASTRLQMVGLGSPPGQPYRYLHQMNSRDEMMAEIKRELIPALREIGFKGSVPHLHRIADDDHVDLVTFQFASGGGSFVIEIGFADPERENVYIYKDTAPKKLRISQTTVRQRLGATDEASDYWFAYDGERPFGITGTPETLAATARDLIQSQAVPWWDAKRNASR